jgi:hypothetical protein
MTNQSCRTCRFLNVTSDAKGRRIPRKDRAYDCVAPIAPLPPLPDSVTIPRHWPPIRCWMAPDEGATCPLWEALK